MDTLVHQARLPHPGLAHHGNDLAVSSACVVERLAQGGNLRLAPHKAGEAPRRSGLEAFAERSGPNQIEHFHGLCHALDRDWPQGVHPHQALDEPQGRGRQANRPRRGQLLHTRCQMRRLPHRRVVHVQIVADGADHHFPGVEPHPDAQLEAVGAPHRVRILAHGGLHGQRGVTGPQGVVFVGQRRPEEGHDAVAQHLVDCALEAVHSLHHVMQGRVEELLGGLRVEVLDQFGRIFDVGEQHCHLLALACQGRAGGQDLLGEIRWGVCQRRMVMV
jgi:hypothetical protein